MTADNPNITGVHHVSLTVTNIDDSLAWYKNVFPVEQVETRLPEELPDVQARPAGPADLPPQARTIDARLTVVFAALAVTNLIGKPTGWSIKKSFALLAATGPSTSARAGMS